MKNNTFLIIAFLCLSVLTTLAQSPQQFKYQAVLRDADGIVKSNQNVNIVIDILQGSITGTSVFTESHVVETSSQGIVNLNIGSITDGLGEINWAEDLFFIKVTVDETEMGTSQVHSVPYALYANKAGNGIDFDETPTEGDILYRADDEWMLLQKGTNGQTLRLDEGLPNWREPGYALPIVTTAMPSDILVGSANSGGHIVSTGYSEITAKGICWSTEQNPDTSNMMSDAGAGIGSFSGTLTDLLPNTTYYVRAYAINGAGAAYGNQVSLTTFQNVVFPTVTTNDITNITANAATSGGNVTSTGGDSVTSRGVCWSDHQNPTISDSKTVNGSATGNFQSQISGLIPGKYYCRAYATNSSGTGYGNMVSFTTEKTIPVLSTKNINNISAMGAVSGGIISSDGGTNITARGICWSDGPNPTINNEKTSSVSTSSSFSAAIAKASPSTTYYLKAFATNELGTGYGEQKTFITSDAAYYTSFETGMTPINWSGPFTVTTESAFDGSYSFMSLYGADCDAILNVTLSKGGQISFYYFYSGHAVSIEIYIDDVMITNYLNDGSEWRQGLISIPTGTHSIKWHYLDNPGTDPWHGTPLNGKCYIDQITITK